MRIPRISNPSVQDCFTPNLYWLFLDIRNDDDNYSNNYNTYNNNYSKLSSNNNVNKKKRKKKKEKKSRKIKRKGKTGKRKGKTKRAEKKHPRVLLSRLHLHLNALGLDPTTEKGNWPTSMVC